LDFAYRNYHCPIFNYLELEISLFRNYILPMGDLTSCNFPLGVLPISIKYFKAQAQNGNVLLTWEKTGNASLEYQIEHSANGIQWTEIANIREMTFPNNNSYLHTEPFQNRNYYRVKHGSQTGTIYSEIRIVSFKNNVHLIPGANPVRNNIQIDNYSQQVTVIIYSSDGRKVKQLKLVSGRNNVEVSTMDPGSYIVSIQSVHGESQFHKTVKQ